MNVLSSLLSNIKDYFSKYFLIANFLPALTFWFLNGLASFLLLEKFHNWIESDLLKSAINSALLVTCAVLAVLIFSIALSALSDFLRGLLEGQWLMDTRLLKFIGKALLYSQERRYRRITTRIEEIVPTRLQAPEWKRIIRQARLHGRQHHAGHNQFGQNDSLITSIRSIQILQAGGDIVPFETLQGAVNALIQSLEKNDANVLDDQAGLLNRSQIELLVIIDKAKTQADAEHTRCYNEITFRFGSGAAIAPTTMGNIAHSFFAYAVRRYNCNLEIFWSQLQQLLRKSDQVAYDGLQDAKARLDFLILSCWLTLVWSAVWGMILGILSVFPWWFFSVAIVGPLIGYFWYRAAAEQYRAFGDVLTTTLDVFRLKLLEEMRLTAPSDLASERWLWDNINQAFTYGDEDINLRFGR
jgi:hypothetical protein